MREFKPVRVHVVTGGFPSGSPAGHDMDYARLRLLQLLQEPPPALATVANDYTDIATWLPDSQLLITYVASPHPNDEQNQVMRQWLEAVQKKGCALLILDPSSLNASVVYAAEIPLVVDTLAFHKGMPVDFEPYLGIPLS